MQEHSVFSHFLILKDYQKDLGQFDINEGKN